MMTSLYLSHIESKNEIPPFLPLKESVLGKALFYTDLSAMSPLTHEIRAVDFSAITSLLLTVFLNT